MFFRSWIRMGTDPTVLDYRAPEAPPSHRSIRRFQVIYAFGIAAAYLTVWFCDISWPTTTNSNDPRKTELAMTIQVAGGAACAWLGLALRRILLSDPIRRSVWTWLLVAANALVALAVLHGSW
jgi:O-antigen ligase